MDGEKFTRESKSSKRRVEPDVETKQKTYGSKLKNDMSRSEAMRKKIRTGKADNRESLQEKKKKAKLRKQGRKKVYAETAVLTRVRSQMAEHNEDNNAGIDSFNSGGQLVESVIHKSVYYAKVKSHDKKSDGYSQKLHEKKYTEEAKNFQRAKETANTSSGAVGSSSKQIQKNLMKKEIQKQAYRKQAQLL